MPDTGILRRRAAALSAAALLAVAACGEALAYKRTKNPKRKKRPAAAAEAGPAKPVGPPPLLAGGRWDPAVRGSIEEFIRAAGKDSPDHDPNDPPAAVFALNEVVIPNDLGEVVFQKMVLSSSTAPGFDFKMDEDFWRILPAAFGQARLYFDYQQLLAMPVSVWPDQPGLRRMRKGFVRMYRDFCARRGRKECRALLARLFRGFTEDEAVGYAKDVIEAELARPVGYAFLEEKDSDPAPEKIRMGLQPAPEMEDLMRVLAKEGFDVWIISEDAQVEVRQLAKHFGLPPERGIGIKAAVSTSTSLMTDEIEPPFPFRSGKVEAVSSIVGKPPAIAVAGQAEDAPLLSYGEGLRLLMDSGDESLRRVAVDRGWLIQPAFPP
ncbi:MAG: haloacid dehalogenase-like hydrolase [Elusimicrobia bacterium]|nr:haloacid dehalogenase-like hydrolase [Elusimicrobiota bacterium]